MNFKFNFSAALIIFFAALGVIEALDSQEDGAGNRRRINDPSPIEEPTFPPVDIRIPIGFAGKESSTQEMVQQPEIEPIQIHLPNTTHNDFEESTDNAKVTPSLPPKMAQPVENEADLPPENPPTNGSNWCPTHFSGNGNACGSDLPSEASWIQCAFSQSNHLKTCTCTNADPFWRCKSNMSNSDAPGAVTGEPSFDSTSGRNDVAKETPTETPTAEANTSIKTPTIEVAHSSSMPQLDSTGPNEVVELPTQESNIGVAVEGKESPSQSSSDPLPVPESGTHLTVNGTDSSAQQASETQGMTPSMTPIESTGTSKVTNPPPLPESGTDVTVDRTESSTQDTETHDVTSPTTPVDSTGTNKLPNPLPPKETEIVVIPPLPESGTDVTIDGTESSTQDTETHDVTSPPTPVDSTGTNKVPNPLSPKETEIAIKVNVTKSPELIPNEEAAPTSEDDELESDPTSSPASMPVDWPSIVKSYHPAHKQSDDTSDKVESPANVPSLPPSPSSDVIVQKLPPGIFAKRSAPPTSMPTISKALHQTMDTSACGDASPADRREIIFRYLRALLGDKTLDNTEDPAFTATSWIADEDQLQLCPDDRNFIQRYVLVLLYFSTSGDDWARCTRAPPSLCSGRRFLSGLDECSWGGVTCDSQNRVIKINLDENNMRGPIPEELSYLEYLYELDFDSNNLVGHFPSWVGKMKHLEKLDLDRNILSGPIPEELYTSTSLRYVDMDRNILSGTISSNIGAMSQLIFFQADFNQLIGAVPTEIANISDLQYFSVFGNGFDEAVGIPFEICGFHTQIYANCEMCEKVGDCCTVCLPEDLRNFYY